MRNGCKWVVGMLLALMAGTAMADMPPIQSVPVPRHVVAPRVSARITADALGLVINTADPYSVEVGEYYAAKRGIAPDHILRVELPVRTTLSVAEFGALYGQIRDQMPAGVQALALAWTQPYAVGCNSMTSAITLGLEPEACMQTCARTRVSPYFNAATSTPFTTLGIRPSMLLASRSVASAKALIDRGVASDNTLGKLGGPPANAVFVKTDDLARNVRSVLFPPAGRLGRTGAAVVLRDQSDSSPLHRVVLYETGVAVLPPIDPKQWLPGALADHLTSFGGLLIDSHGQSNALDWLESGATASYGTVTEPCNHIQKFPHPQVLLLHYMQGASAIEAYWKSVAWPAEGVFVGEPLAAPFMLQ